MRLDNMVAHDVFLSATRCVLVLAACVLANSTTVLAQEGVEGLVTTCAACHGENGIPQDKATPVIWGQNEGYMYLQLRDFQKGTRKSEQMRAIVDGLERADLRALAAHFSKLEWPNLGQAEAPPDVEKKAKTASLAMSCTVCHQGEYEGDGTTGRIAGQSRAYLDKTASDFRTKERANNPGMASVYRSMEQDDIDALNEYLAGLRLQSTAGRR
ncbi:MAG: c-type cytochrome [Hyphomicrobium sp.]|nr:cytochrome c4 [Hyphomicrobiaceae bacterium]